MIKEKSCGAVIVKEEKSRYYTLIIRQTQGHWCFPKGHVEGDETEHETAYREIREETGIDVHFIDGFRETTHYSPYEGVEKKVVYFLARPEGGSEVLQEDEVVEMRWVNLVDAGALLTYRNDAALLKKAVRFLREKNPYFEDKY